MKERARISRRGVGRHSRTMAKGRGDARDHRRENQRLTETDLDRNVLETDKEGRLTLKVGSGLASTLATVLKGKGLETADDGSLQVMVGLNLSFDSKGRLAVNVGNSIRRVLDSSGGTVDPEGEVTGANANAIATLTAKVNELMDALQTTAKT